LPDLRPEERQHFNRLQDDSLFQLFDVVLGPERAQLYNNYAFRIKPVDDDQPFFSQFLRWSQLNALISLYGQRNLPFIELGMLVAVLAAGVLSLLATLLILLPLTRLPKGSGKHWQVLIYFGGLGVGYMWTELALIHRFVLYLGHPVYATALVVAVLLIGSATGSALTGRFRVCRPWRWTAATTSILLLYVLLLGTLLDDTAAGNATTRCIGGAGAGTGRSDHGHAFPSRAETSQPDTPGRGPLGLGNQQLSLGRRCRACNHSRR